MKRVAVTAIMLLFVVSIALADAAGMSFAEIQAELAAWPGVMWRSAQWAYVDVPVGAWTVGEIIPAGDYLISGASKYDFTYTLLDDPEEWLDEDAAIHLADGEVFTVIWGTVRFRAVGYQPAFAGAALPEDDSAEQLARRDQLQAELMARPEWQRVRVPIGRYYVGEQIPAGRWAIHPPENGDAVIMSGNELFDSGNLAWHQRVWIADPEGRAARYGATQPGAVFDLADGMIVDVERGDAWFTPFDGWPGFEFGR